jgi:CBS domain-containing protein
LDDTIAAGVPAPGLLDPEGDQSMRAADIMSAPAVSVGAHTPVKEIAALLFEKRISAVPVLDEGRLIGLVSEGDLLRRQELGIAAENISGVRAVQDHRVPFYRPAGWE